MTASSKPTKKIRSSFYISIFILISIACANFLFFVPDIVFEFNRILRPGVATKSSAEFGDTFGFANAALSALAFAGLIVTMLMQRKELSLQREDLSESRAIFDEQRSILKSQHLESTLFSMLEVQQHTVLSISIDSTTNTHGKSTYQGGEAGHSAIVSIRNSLRHQIRESGGHVIQKPDQEEMRRRFLHLSGTYGNRYIDQFSDALAAYMRITYRIFKFIYECDATENEKILWSRVARAKLSNAELFIILYNCISTLGREKFLPLAEHYNLFDNLSVRELADERDFFLVKSDFYDVPAAYADAQRFDRNKFDETK